MIRNIRIETSPLQFGREILTRNMFAHFGELKDVTGARHTCPLTFDPGICESRSRNGPKRCDSERKSKAILYHSKEVREMASPRTSFAVADHRW